MDGESVVTVIMDGKDGEPGAGLVSVEVKGLRDGESSMATELRILIEGVSDQGTACEVRVEMAAGSGTNQTIAHREHTRIPLDDFSVEEAPSLE